MAKRDVEASRGHLAELRRVVIDRYQLTEPYDSQVVKAIDAAIAAGAEADVARLRALIEGVNLYPRHAALALAEIDSIEAAFAEEPSPEVPNVTPLGRQNKAELIATAAAHGVEVPEGATVAQLREALAPVGFPLPEVDPESESEVDQDPETSAPWTRATPTSTARWNQPPAR